MTTVSQTAIGLSAVLTQHHPLIHSLTGSIFSSKKAMLYCEIHKGNKMEADKQVGSLGMGAS